jgi:hypothetical protein
MAQSLTQWSISNLDLIQVLAVLSVSSFHLPVFIVESLKGSFLIQTEIYKLDRFSGFRISKSVVDVTTKLTCYCGQTLIARMNNTIY